jgi:hypothetical protein
MDDRARVRVSIINMNLAYQNVVENCILFQRKKNIHYTADCCLLSIPLSSIIIGWVHLIVLL